MTNSVCIHISIALFPMNFSIQYFYQRIQCNSFMTCSLFYYICSIVLHYVLEEYNYNSLINYEKDESLANQSRAL